MTMRSRVAERWIGILALVLSVFLALPLASAAADDGDSQPSLAMQIKSLTRLTQSLEGRLATLEARASALRKTSQPPVPQLPTGPLAGALTGTFSQPVLAAATVGSAEIVNGSIQPVDLAAGRIVHFSDGGIPFERIEGGAIEHRNIAAGAVTGDNLLSNSLGLEQLGLIGPSELGAVAMEMDHAGDILVQPGANSRTTIAVCRSGRAIGPAWRWANIEGADTHVFEAHRAPDPSTLYRAESAWEYRVKVGSDGTANTFEPSVLCLR
jgi:hypothetical protein